MSRIVTSIALPLLFLAPMQTAPAVAGDGHACSANAVDAQAILECHASASGSSAAGSTVPAGSTATYEYLWLPACPDALPRTTGAGGFSCVGERTCTNQNLTRQTLW